MKLSNQIAWDIVLSVVVPLSLYRFTTISSPAFTDIEIGAIMFSGPIAVFLGVVGLVFNLVVYGALDANPTAFQQTAGLGTAVLLRLALIIWMSRLIFRFKNRALSFAVPVITSLLFFLFGGACVMLMQQ